MAKRVREAYLEEPPAEQLLDETRAPEDVSVQVRVDHPGVDHVGGHGAPLGGQQPLQVVGEQDKGQLALGVGAVRGVAAAVGAKRGTCETPMYPSPAGSLPVQVPTCLGPSPAGSLPAQVPTCLGLYLQRFLPAQVPHL